MNKKLKLLCALALAVPGIAAAEKYVMVTHTAGTDPFWPVVQKGAEDAAAAMGVDLDYRHPNTGDLVEMARIVETAIAQNPDGLVVSLPDISVLGDSIRAAVAAGIPVITINSGGDVAHELGVLFHVGQPEYEAGYGAGAKHKSAGVTNALCLSPEAFNVSLEQRCNGYRDGSGAAKVDMLDTTGDPVQIKSRTSAALSKDSSIDGILAVSPHVCAGALEALKELGLDGEIPFGCFDLSPEVIQAIQAGQVDFTVDQQQYLQGYMPIVALSLHSKYGLVPGADILSGPGFVTKENADIVLEFAGKTR